MKKWKTILSKLINHQPENASKLETKGSSEKKWNFLVVEDDGLKIACRTELFTRPWRMHWELNGNIDSFSHLLIFQRNLEREGAQL